MTFKLAAAEAGGVICWIADKRHDANIEIPDGVNALDELARAMDGVERAGVGEAFWHQPTGEYRWLFRREGVSDRARICVLKSIGTLTGWENVFWSEDDLKELVQSVRSEIARYRQSVH